MPQNWLHKPGASRQHDARSYMAAALPGFSTDPRVPTPGFSSRLQGVLSAPFSSVLFRAKLCFFHHRAMLNGRCRALLYETPEDACEAPQRLSRRGRDFSHYPRTSSRNAAKCASALVAPSVGLEWIRISPLDIPGAWRRAGLVFCPSGAAPPGARRNSSLLSQLRDLEWNVHGTGCAKCTFSRQSIACRLPAPRRESTAGWVPGVSTPNGNEVVRGPSDTGP